MKVFFDARLLLEKPTGIGQYIVSLLPEMIRQAPDVEWCLLRRPNPWPGYGVKDWSFPNLTHRETNERHMSWTQHVTVPRQARAEGADLLHYPHFDAPVRFSSIPVVATLYDAKYLLHAEFAPNLAAWKRVAMRRLYRDTVRRAARVVAISEHTADDLERLFGGPRATVIPLAADAAFRPASEDARAKFRTRYGLRRPFVLSVGEFRVHKNHERLIRAFAASEEARDHDLVVLGRRHPDGVRPEELAAAAGVEERVKVIDDASHEDLAAAYSEAGLMALVSRYEGFGLPLLEAMQCGAPVLSSSTTASAEVVQDGGLLVDPLDEAAIAAALDRVLASPEERERWRMAGTRRAAEFSWERAAAETLAVYREVAGP